MENKIVAKLTALMATAVLIPSLVVAAGSGGHEGIPWGHLIVPQIVNFSIFATILFVLLRGPVKSFFAEKGLQFSSAVQRAEEAKFKAQEAHDEIKKRYESLKTSAEMSRANALAESAKMKLKIIEEAKAAAVKLESEALKNISYEQERMISLLRAELITNSFKVAQDQISQETSVDKLTQLQKDFAKKASAAGRGAF